MAFKIAAMLALVVSLLHVAAFCSAGHGYRRYFGGVLLLRALAAAYLALFLCFLCFLIQ